MKNSIWLLLPVATMFAMFYLAFEVIPFGPNPFTYWWDFPLMIVMVLGWFSTLFLGLDKGSN